MLIPHLFDYYSFELWFEMSKWDVSSYKFLKSALAIQGPLWFPKHFKTLFFFYFCENDIWILKGIILNL